MGQAQAQAEEAPPPLSQPRFVVVGTGRSASGWIAEVLTRSGIPTGHEQVWNPENPTGSPLPLHARDRDIVGDSSWLAVRHLPLIRSKGIKVFHQVRFPLDVVSSFAKAPIPPGPYLDETSRIMGPLLTDDIDQAQLGLNWWVVCNKICEGYADMTWRLDEVDELLVRRVAATVLHPCDPVVDVEHWWNSHGHGDQLTWEDLPASYLRDEAAAMWVRYGGGL